MVVIVVPALAERDEREQPIIAARIARAIALLAEYMREGIDGVRAVIAQDRGDEESPYEHLPAVRAELRRHVLEQHTQKEHTHRQCDRHQDVEAIEQAQLRVLQ